ncbi:MAG TPA: MFS transporter [Anaerolineales bacterium]|nr:MFS transporter [Anaerolineales bacterium]
MTALAADNSNLSTPLPWHRLVALNALAFALGVVTNTLEPAVLGNRTLAMAPGAKNTVIGLITFAGLVVAVLWQPVIGDLSDRTQSRWGRRLPYFVAGGAALIAAVYLVASAPNLAALLVLLLLLQLSSNTVQAPSQALIPDHVPEGQRGAAAGWKSALEILAFVLGRQISGHLVAQGMVVAAVSVAAVTVAAAVAVVAFTIRRTTVRAASAPAPRPDLRRAFRFERHGNPSFGPWFFNRVLVWGGFVALNTFLLFFVIDVLGLAEAQAQRFVGDLSALMGIGLLLVALPAGWLADRVGRKRLVAAASLSAGGGTVLLLLAPTTTTALVAGCILGVSVGVFLTASWALATQIVPGVQAARMLGLANIATAVGSGLARLGGALIIDPFNRLTGSTAGGYLLLFALAGVAFFAGAVAILRMPSDTR